LDIRIRFANISTRASIAIVGLILLLAAGCSSETQFADVATEIPDPQQSVPDIAEPPSLSEDPVVELGPLGEWDPEETSKVWAWLKQNRWDTDFRYRTVHLTEIEFYNFRDSILPIDQPEFSHVSKAPGYMSPDEPVVAVVLDGEARAYPLAILMWHEIVNDSIGDTPIAITYCPLCNTAIIFDRTVDGQRLTFGTTGSIRNGDLVMWDRSTQSWWQQITGEAIVGDYALSGAALEVIPSTIVPWDRFVAEYPDGMVLIRMFEDDGEPVRSYDTPPYTGYDNSDRRPFAYEGEVDRQLIVTSRVLSLSEGDVPVVYPFDFLAEHPVVNDVVDGVPIVAVFDDWTRSSFRGYDDVMGAAGSATAFSRLVGGRLLTFEVAEESYGAAGSKRIIDVETRTTWSLSGRAIEGELAGEQLRQVLHGNDFWFAIALFWPDTEIRDSLDDLVVG
jgi:hypothetical protein